MKQAYTEMLEGCLSNPDKRIWYVIWNMELEQEQKQEQKKENEKKDLVGQFC